MAEKIGNMARTIMRQLEDFGVAEGLVVDAKVEKIAKETSEELTRTSPKLTGDYAASWTFGNREVRRHKKVMSVYAEKPEYALTHLLEKGHQNRGGGRTPGIPHIAPVEKTAVENLEKELLAEL